MEEEEVWRPEEPVLEGELGRLLVEVVCDLWMGVVVWRSMAVGDAPEVFLVEV